MNAAQLRSCPPPSSPAAAPFQCLWEAEPEARRSAGSTPTSQSRRSPAQICTAMKTTGALPGTRRVAAYIMLMKDIFTFGLSNRGVDGPFGGATDLLTYP